MILTVNELLNIYETYSDPLGKIHREAKKGNLYQVIKGLYETDQKVSGHLLAGVIYGPSYLSFEYALAFHGLIPERVYTFTSATYNKNKRKNYSNVFGMYTYRDVPKKAFPLEVVGVISGDYSYVMATPEKALCDTLYIKPPQTSMKRLKELMFDDMRIEEDDFYKLDVEKIVSLCEVYSSTNLKLLRKIVLKGTDKYDID